MRRALTNSRASNFGAWYQEVIRKADLAEVSAVRGCMVIKPNGYGIWEQIQQGLDRRFKETGHENCYFPLFIPIEFISKEAEHVEGFAKEMAVVTHHRLKQIDGKLVPDPDSKLSQPLIVRPTSETIIADSFRKWIRTHRDLPILINQWANVVRWEMRTRLFLRTAEFLWQEGHTAHATREEAFAETLQMLEIYRDFAETEMSMPVIPGEKTANERFPGADNSFTIEAMMQDGRALQSGTSHYLGTHFSSAQGIYYESKAGIRELVHTTSWGASTRLIGGLIMTHSDDDGLSLPPRLAPKQIVIVPRLRGDGSDGEVLSLANRLALQLRGVSQFGALLRVHIDLKSGSASSARWDWVRRGTPIIVEIGSREVKADQVLFLRRDQLYLNEKVSQHVCAVSMARATLPEVLQDIQHQMLQRAKVRRDSMITDGLSTFADLAAYFGRATDDAEDVYEEAQSVDERATASGPSVVSECTGWVRASWCEPIGRDLQEITERLAALRLTIRCAPLAQPSTQRRCIFTGAPGTQEILLGRAY